MRNCKSQNANLKFAFCHFRLDITVEIPIERNRDAAAHKPVGGPWELLPEAGQGPRAQAKPFAAPPVVPGSYGEGVAVWDQRRRHIRGAITGAFRVDIFTDYH